MFHASIPQHRKNIIMGSLQDCHGMTMNNIWCWHGVFYPLPSLTSDLFGDYRSSVCLFVCLSLLSVCLFFVFWRRRRFQGGYISNQYNLGYDLSPLNEALFFLNRSYFGECWTSGVTLAGQVELHWLDKWNYNGRTK